MKLIVKKTYEEMSKEAAQIFKEEIEKNPEIVLGLATGSTPEGTYNELIRMHKEEGLDFSKVTTFNLDEYVGLSGDHKGSYRYYMYDKLFNHINIKKENIHIPNGLARDLDSYCKEYDKEIENAGGIDLQLLGVGTNGHIAFNEPDDELSIGSYVEELTKNTIEDNSRFFESKEETPNTAITMGMGGILKAKKIILMANGKHKANIMKDILTRNTISTKVPASLLLIHPNLTVIIDQDAYWM